MRTRTIAIIKEIDRHSFTMDVASRNISGDEVLGLLGYFQEHPEWKIISVGIPFAPGLTLASVDELAARDIAGALIESKSIGAEPFCRKHGIPVVATNRYFKTTDVPTVCPDDVAIGRLAARYFLRRGFRSLAFCGPDYLTNQLAGSIPARHFWWEWRLQGFRQAASEAGAIVSAHPERYEWPDGESKKACVARSVHDLRAWIRALPKPVGILGCADTWAADCLAVCREEGIAVPNEVAILGVDNHTVRCMACRPSLSSIDRNMWRIGYEAAARLCRRIEGKDGGESQMQLVPPKGVVERLSTDALAVADPKLATALRFVRKNYSRPISRTDVARAARVSERSLDRLFQRDLGFALVDEIRRLRLEKACELLTGSDLPLKLVAEASGFRSETYLCRVFSQEMGMSPAAWRGSQGHGGEHQGR